VGLKLTAPIRHPEELEMLLAAGADEFYCGAVPREWLERFTGAVWLNRRSPIGGNLETLGDLRRLIDGAHAAGRPVFLTLNAPLYADGTLRAVLELARAYRDAGADALIVADPGAIVALREEGIAVPIHLSSLAPALSAEAVAFFADLGVARVILPRHLRLAEIASIAERTRGRVELEVFLLNDGCAWEEGTCMTTHHHAVGALCSGLAGFGHRFEGAGRALSEAEVASLERNLSDWHAFVADLGGHPDRLSPAGLPYGPCGLCALPAFARAGIDALKIVGREHAPIRKFLSVKMARAILDRVRRGEEEAALVEAAKSIRGDRPSCDSGRFCAYRPGPAGGID
jgi:putative protease